MAGISRGGRSRIRRAPTSISPLVARSFNDKSDPPEPGSGSGHKETVLLRDKVESRTDPDARLYKMDWFYRLTVVAYNLVRMRKPIPIQAPAV
jgi:hypothetical protein